VRSGWREDSVRSAVNFLMKFVDSEGKVAGGRVVKVVEFFYGEPERTLVGPRHEGGGDGRMEVGVGSTPQAGRQPTPGCDLVVASRASSGRHVRGRVSPALPLLEAVLRGGGN